MDARMGWLKRVLRVSWKLAIVAVVVGFIVYRYRFAPIPVASQVAAVGPIAAEVLGTGTLEARIQTTISPRVSGLLTQVMADQGERVTKGQLLALLYDGDLRQQVEIAKADLALATAIVNRSAVDIVRAEATSRLTRTELIRVTQLQKTNAATVYELDVVTERNAVAQADIKHAQLTKVEAEKAVIKAQESLRYFQERLADTKIVAPFDGLVIRRSREPGDVVVPGSEILQIISTDQMWISAWVDETAMASIVIGQPARIVFRSQPDKPCNGSVTRIAPLADRETREFIVDLTIKELPKTWAVGQRTEVYIQTASKDQALLVPQAAVIWQKGKPGLFVSDARHAQWRNVTLGLRGTETVEVTEGLTAGEIVIWLHDPKNSSLTEGRAVAPANDP